MRCGEFPAEGDKCLIPPQRGLRIFRMTSSWSWIMLPNPMHPAVVHFPVVLAFLLPLFAIGAIWTIRRGTRARAAWSIPLAVAVGLAASSGEGQSERVERVISEQRVESHEEMAEAFMAASMVLVATAAAGMIGGVVGKTARVVSVAGALVLVAGAAKVGHSGGQLVYKYGAARAYARPDTAGGVSNVSDGDVRRPAEEGERR
jgi:uncharacterized membrane protein